MRHQRNAQYHGVKSNAPLTEMNRQTYIRAGAEGREYAAQHVDGLWTTCV